MKPTKILLAGSGTLIIAGPIFSSTFRSNNLVSHTHVITKTISETIVRSIASHHELGRNGLSFEDTNTEHPLLADDTYSKHHNSLRAFFTDAQPNKPQRLPSDVPAIPSKRPPNVHRADSQDQTSKQPDYWPIMIHLNGYDVEIPVLRGNATKFCETVMKDAGAGKGSEPSSAIASKATSTKSESENTVATNTQANDAATSSAAPTTSKTSKSTDDVASSTSEAKSSSSSKGRQTTDASTLTSDTTDHSSTEEPGSSVATPTGEKSPSTKPSTTDSLTSDGNAAVGDSEVDASVVSTPSSTPKSTKPTQSATTADPDSTTSSDEATSTSAKKSKPVVTSAEISDAQAAEATTHARNEAKEIAAGADGDSFVQYTSTPTVDSSFPTADTTSLPTTISSEANNKVKAKRTAGLPSEADKIVPWYHAPFVWRKVVDSGDNTDEVDSNDQKVEIEQEDNSQDGDEEDEQNVSTRKATAKPAAKTFTNEDDTLTTSASLKTKPTKSSTLYGADVNAAVDEPVKPTFGIQFSSTADATPTSDSSDKPDEDVSTSSSEKPTITTQDDTEPSKKTRPSETVESTKSDPRETPANTTGSDPTTAKPASLKPTKSAKPTATGTDTDTDTDTAIKTPPSANKTGGAGATPAETNDTTSKHAPNVKGFLSWYLFWGILYLCMGFWGVWRQTRADFHWKGVDGFVGEYGRNVQGDGRTPVQYLFGLAKE